MEELDKTQKANFLQFVTGTSKVPLEGFKALRGMSGIRMFNIHKAFDTTLLPITHTWYIFFLLIDLFFKFQSDRSTAISNEGDFEEETDHCNH